MLFAAKLHTLMDFLSNMDWSLLTVIKLLQVSARLGAPSLCPSLRQSAADEAQPDAVSNARPCPRALAPSRPRTRAKVLPMGIGGVMMSTDFLHKKVRRDFQLKLGCEECAADEICGQLC